MCTSIKSYIYKDKLLPQILAALFAFILGQRIRLVKTRSSLDALKYKTTVGAFDYRRLAELSIEKPKSLDV